MLKWKIVLILIVVLFAGLFVGPYIFYYFSLPSQSVINSAKSTKLFFNFTVQEESFFSNPENLPTKEFNCSVCYPHPINSEECNERMSIWISRNLLAGEAPERMIFYHLKNYFLSKAVRSKYDEASLYRIYLAFISRPLNSKSIEQACVVRFKKSCPELTYEESLDLELEARLGSNKVPMDNLRKNINAFCAEK